MMSLRSLLVAALFGVATVCVQAAPLGDFDGHGDIGAPKIAGTATYDASKQEYAITGSGTNMWGTRDEYHWAWKKLSGDFILRTRAHFLGQGVDPHRKLGWIIRPSEDADAPYVDIAAHGDGLLSLQYRKVKGGITRQFVLPLRNADVLQLERRGGKVIVSGARYGETFVSNEISDVELGDAVLGGLFVCAHNPDVKEQAIFRDVRVIKPIHVGFTPYREYIGSHLEILDVETGNLERIHSAAEPFEAPNWTPDGAALIYNVSGSGPNKGVLHRFDLATRKPTQIDTGFAVNNNNDHVLSFDGKMMGISNHSADMKGQSTIYVLPATGGTPRQVTPLAPSYLHGWSPDAKWLTYTGGRAEQPGGPLVYSIYKIPVEGGAEVRLTRGDWLDDGPEFSPDGAYIYFNSTRSGLMQLWRMKPDGSEQEQLTGDGLNNWFPHLSPDGKWIAFVSYGQDVKPADHPYYKHVYIRLLATDGNSAPRVLAYVYGGQGTINVPSWSPDGKKIAFVSNDGFAK